MTNLNVRMCLLFYIVTVFLSVKEFPHDDENDDDYSTVDLTVRASSLKASTTASDSEGHRDKSDDDEEDDDFSDGGQVVGRVRVRRDAFDHLDTQHVDELWRRTEDLLERSAVTDAMRRLTRRRRDVDYWQQLMTLLDQLDRVTVRRRHTVTVTKVFIMLSLIHI